MSSFIRRYLVDPGNSVLLNVESVNVIDLDPPASITGVGTGTVIMVGEFENGPFATPTQVAGATDLVRTFGELGYRNAAGAVGNNPCARSRKADSAVNAESWNGNGFVQLNAKSFAALILVRVDTSIGQVTLNRQASVTGAQAFTYDLEPGQVLSLDAGSGFTSSTFSATAAAVTSSSQTFPDGFVGGETLTLGYDDAANFVVTFLSTDTTQAAVIARINAYAGFAFASSVTGTTMRLTGLKRGTGAQVRVVAASAGGVLTALGLTVGVTTGTGNVSNIDAVTFNEVRSIVQTAMSSGVTVELDSQQRLRISKVYSAAGDYVTVGPLTTATALGFTAYQHSSNDGLARLRSGTGSFPASYSGGETLTLQVDDQNPVVVTFQSGDTTQALQITRINLAMGYTCASSVSSTITLFTGVKNGGRVTVVAGTASVLTSLGLTAPLTVQATAVVAGTLPAGTVVRNSGNTNRFVTMQDVAVTVASTGPYTAKVRHALDDGTGVSATAGTLTVLDAAPDVASFAVNNLAQVNAALTEGQIDAAYATAIDATLDMSSVCRVANIIFSARQSNAVRRKLRQNVLTASSSGMYGRMACIRPPLGITRDQAKSNVAEPGVGAYRDQRVVYNYPGVNTFVPQIAAVGTAGGAGFTATGNVDVGMDGFCASIMSQLPPEEDPGQATDFASGVNSLETSPNAQGYVIDDYIAFKAAGISAPRMDDGKCVLQSGCTSVDPAVYPNLADINRRRMADYVEDSLAQRGKSFGKKLQTVNRRIALANEQVAFLSGLRSKNNPDNQRIDSYSVDRITGNTPALQAQGMYRLIIKVRTLSSFKSIVLQSTIGTSVEVDEVAGAA